MVDTLPSVAEYDGHHEFVSSGGNTPVDWGNSHLNYEQHCATTFIGADINSGPKSSSPTQLANVNGQMYLSANDWAHGFELWRRSGTATSTVLWNNFFKGAQSGDPESITAMGNRVFVAARTAETGPELNSQAFPTETADNDAIVAMYSGTPTSGTLTVTVSTNGGPVSTLGTFSANVSIILDEVSGNNSIRVVGTSGHDQFRITTSRV